MFLKISLLTYYTILFLCVYNNIISFTNQINVLYNILCVYILFLMRFYNYFILPMI